MTRYDGNECASVILCDREADIRRWVGVERVGVRGVVVFRGLRE